jgi:ribonuclease D
LSAQQVADTLPKSVARRYTEALIAEHSRGREQPELPRLEAPLSQAQGALGKKLRTIARDQAETLEMSQELLARKRDIEACIRHYRSTGELSPEYSGWREPLVGAAFRQTLEQQA